MRKKTSEQMAQERAKKVLRTAIRLKHSLEADEEINATIPDVIEEMDRQMTGGKKKAINAAAVFKEIK